MLSDFIEAMLADGSFEQLRLTLDNDPDANILTKLEPIEIEGVAPETIRRPIEKPSLSHLLVIS